MGDLQVNGINDIVNLFANKFSTVYTSNNIPYRTIPSIINDCISGMFFTIDEVSKCINDLASNLSEGLDKISILYIENCKNILLSPITTLFNLSIKLSIYPSLFIECFISPTFKSGDSCG